MTVNLLRRITFAKKFTRSLNVIDDYAKMADQRWSDIYVVFTKILCGRNFCLV